MNDWRAALDPHRPDGYTNLMDIDRRRLALNQERDADQARFAARCEVQSGLVLCQDRMAARSRAAERRALMRLEGAAETFMVAEGLMLP